MFRFVSGLFPVFLGNFSEKKPESFKFPSLVDIYADIYLDDILPSTIMLNDFY